MCCCIVTILSTLEVRNSVWDLSVIQGCGQRLFLSADPKCHCFSLNKPVAGCTKVLKKPVRKLLKTQIRQVIVRQQNDGKTNSSSCDMTEEEHLDLWPLLSGKYLREEERCSQKEHLTGRLGSISVGRLLC